MKKLRHVSLNADLARLQKVVQIGDFGSYGFSSLLLWFMWQVKMGPKLVRSRITYKITQGGSFSFYSKVRIPRNKL